MATVTRKPQVRPADEQAREAAIAAVIQKGMGRPAEPADPADPVRQVVLFLPASLLAEVDALVLWFPNIRTRWNT